MKVAIGLLSCVALASAQSLGSVLMNNMTTELVTLIKGVPGLMDQLGMAKNITILAPTNDAIMKFTKKHKKEAMDSDKVSNVLMYHVLNGTIKSQDIMASSMPMFPHTMLTNMTWEKVMDGQYVMAEAEDKKITFTSGMMKKSNVVLADVMFDGGVIHMIDRVLSIPRNVCTTATDAGLTSVADAIMKVNLKDKLQSMDNMTLFAPANKAFDAVSAVMKNASMADMTKVLEYHVIPNSVLFSTDLMDGAMMTTANGASVTIHKVGMNWFVNDAMITTPNVLVANGAVHVIDSVLNPDNASASPMPTATAGAAEFGDSSSNGAMSTDTGSMTSTMSDSAKPTNGFMTPASKGSGAMHGPLPYMGAVAVGAALFL